MFILHLGRPEVLNAALVAFTGIDVVQNHALRQQLGEGLIDLDQIQIAHHLGPKTGIQQVQDSVFNATDVLIHRHPIICTLSHHLLVVRGIAIPHEIPAGIHKRVHRVGFASRRLATYRAHHPGMKAFVFVQRVAGAIGHAVLRQYHRQVFFRYWHRTMFGAVDDGNRRAPVTLAAHTPITQAPGGFFLTQAPHLQGVGNGINGRLERQTAIAVGVDRHAAGFVTVPVIPLVVVVFKAVNQHHLNDVDAIFLGKQKVALIVRGHAHDSAIAITHQHVVSHPQVNWVAIQRVLDGQPGFHADFFPRSQFCLGGTPLLAFVDKCGQGRVGSGGMLCQRVLGCNRAKRHAHDGVGTGCEDKHLAVTDQGAICPPNVMGEGKTNPFTFPDPVLLHQLHAVRPARQAALHALQQLGCVVGNLQVVAWNLTPLDRRTGTPALAVDHLFVGQHSLVYRVPVHHLGFAVGNAFFQHFQKQPLVPAVITGITSGNLAAPVNRQTHRLHLHLHVGDVFIGPLGRWHAVFHGGVFGRQTKGIPAHRHQDIKALHTQLACEHVIDRVVAHMAHVQLATGVGQHGAGVELLFQMASSVTRVFGNTVTVCCVPMGLRFALHGLWVVFFFHAAILRAREAGRADWHDRQLAATKYDRFAASGRGRAGRIRYKPNAVEPGFLCRTHQFHHFAIGHRFICPQLQLGFGV